VGGKRFVAFLLQSLVSSAFGIDIHLASSIWAGIMINHVTGVVIGKTAAVSYGRTILHGVVSLFFLLVTLTLIQSSILPSLTIFYLIKTDPQGERRPLSKDREACFDRGGHPDPQEDHRGKQHKDWRGQRCLPFHPQWCNCCGSAHEDHQFHGQGPMAGQYHQHEFGGSGAAFRG
jgi:hypothetical protein